MKRKKNKENLVKEAPPPPGRELGENGRGRKGERRDEYPKAVYIE